MPMDDKQPIVDGIKGLLMETDNAKAIQKLNALYDRLDRAYEQYQIRERAKLRRVLVSLAKGWGMKWWKVERMPLPSTIYDDLYMVGNEENEDAILATERLQTYLKSKGC